MYLVFRRDFGRMEETSIEGAEMELADDDRFIFARGQFQVRDAVPVLVETDDVAEFARRTHGDFGISNEAASQVQLVRCRLGEFSLDGTEIGFCELFRKREQVVRCFFDVGRLGFFGERFPCCVIGSPGLVQRVDGFIFRLQIVEENLFCNLLGGTCESPQCL